MTILGLLARRWSVAPAGADPESSVPEPTVLAPSDGNAPIDSAPAPDAVEVVGSSRTSVEVEQDATLVVHLTDQDGAAVPKVRLQAFRHRATDGIYPSFYATTDAAGFARFRLGASEYQLTTEDSRTHAGAIKDRLALAPGSETRVDLVAIRKDATLRVNVRDTQGAPIGAVSVTCENLGSRMDSTDSRGEVEFAGLGAGRTRLRLDAHELARARLYTDRAMQDVDSVSKEVLNATFIVHHLGCVAVTFSGVDEGEPLTGSVGLIPVGNGESAQMELEPAESTNIWVRPGEYDVFAFLDGATPYVCVDEPRVIVREGLETRVVLATTKGRLQTKGFVRDASGKPLAHVGVRIRPAAGSDVPSKAGYTDADGAFRLQGVPDPPWRVAVFMGNDEHPHTMFVGTADHRWIDVLSEPEDGWTITLRNGYTIRAALYDENLKPLRRSASVEVTPYFTKTSGLPCTMSDGPGPGSTALIHHLSPDTYTLKCTVEGVEGTLHAEVVIDEAMDPGETIEVPIVVK